MPPAPSSPSFIVESLAKHHNRKAFSCGIEPLDRYLKEAASQDARRGIAAPFVLVNKTNPHTILGYYTLSAYGITSSNLPDEMAKKLPGYDLIPATLLGRFAIDQSHRRQGLGGELLSHALERASTQSEFIASYAVVVDAIDQNAISFYKSHGFLPFQDHPDRLFLPMKTIAALFKKP